MGLEPVGMAGGSCVVMMGGHGVGNGWEMRATVLATVGRSFVGF